jgi:esterase/lipase
MTPAPKHHASADGEKRERRNNSSKQVVAPTSTPFYWKMSHPLLALFFFSLAVGEAFFCGPALPVSSFAAARVHGVKKTTSVFYANPDGGDSEIEKMQKLLEYQAAEIKEKDAENLNLKFEGVKKEIRTSTEGLKKDIDALKKDLDSSTEGLKKEIRTSTEGLKKDIDTSTEGLKKDIDALKKDLDTSTEGLKNDIDALKKDLDTSTKGLKNDIKGLDTKFDRLNIIIIVIACAAFLEKNPSLLASFLKQ